MSLEDTRYAVSYALQGVFRPGKTCAYLRAKRQADREWKATRPSPLAGLGTVTHLSVLPLVDLYPSRDDLAGEPGVSYLVTVSGGSAAAGGAEPSRATRVRKYLFDTGLNPKREHPSPLLRNMERLGVRVDDFDAVFISHLHLDHVGGPRQMRERTFTLSAQLVEIGDLPAYVPTDMTHPTARVEVVTEPRVLDTGVASSGPMTRAIWLMGPIAEHTLLVNVEGKGVVMIVGCGHPQLERLVERAKAITGAPLYGIVGGLHFPVTCSRVGKGGQTIIGNGKLPWQRIRRREVRAAAAGLAALDLGLVALSAHDSCDWALDTFQQTLGERFRMVRAGEEIVVA